MARIAPSLQPTPEEVRPTTATPPSSESYRRILLTGGTGFVGGWLAPRLTQQWPQAERFLLRRSANTVSHPGWTDLIGDLRDRESLNQVLAMAKPDLILHLGAQASVGAAVHQMALTWDTNLGGTVNLARACARYAPETVFFNVSSCEVYGRSFLNGSASEGTPPQPASAYARSKFAAEMALLDLLPKTSRTITVRPFNHTGRGQDQRFVLPSFAAQLVAIERGQQPPVLKVGNLSALREFLDVRDVVDAYIGIIAQASMFTSGEILNISSGQPSSVEEVLAQMCGLVRCSPRIEIDPARLRPSDIPCATGNSDKLRMHTGWTPTIALRQTLTDLLEYSRTR